MSWSVGLHSRGFITSKVKLYYLQEHQNSLQAPLSPPLDSYLYIRLQFSLQHQQRLPLVNTCLLMMSCECLNKSKKWKWQTTVNHNFCIVTCIVLLLQACTAIILFSKLYMCMYVMIRKLSMAHISSIKPFVLILHQSTVQGLISVCSPRMHTPKRSWVSPSCTHCNYSHVYTCKCSQYHTRICYTYSHDNCSQQSCESYAKRMYLLPYLWCVLYIQSCPFETLCLIHPLLYSPRWSAGNICRLKRSTLTTSDSRELSAGKC
jgi:hypothetical protein